MLSARTTAVTTPDAFDEPFHLALAFQIAGFAHTVATLWPISDPIALVLATDFYRYLTDGRPPAEALHQAIRACRANPATRDIPQLWASHVHFGP